jgi:DNA replication protein DnaC
VGQSFKYNSFNIVAGFFFSAKLGSPIRRQNAESRLCPGTEDSGFAHPCGEYRRGLGKTHLGTALAYECCLAGHTVLFTTAIDIVNTLAAAQSTHRLKAELKKYINPDLVLIDELGYLPIDKIGADLLFQVFSQRYETGSTIVTTNQPYKNWPKIFNNDSTLTSAVLDRLLHHAETVIVEGRSYRMKDQIETP